jgi:hypothetical protein
MSLYDVALTVTGRSERMEASTAFPNALLRFQDGVDWYRLLLLAILVASAVF